MGRLTLLSFERVNKEIVWEYVCQCGEKGKIRSAYLSKIKTKGRRFECTKCRKARRCPDIANMKKGRWTVIERCRLPSGKTGWLCKCDCGTERKRSYSSITKEGGKESLSCGCRARKLQSKWVNTSLYPPSHGLRSKKASEYQGGLYHCRNAMVAGCYDPKNKRYKIHGALGHTVCELWRNGAEAFFLWCKEQGYKDGDGLYLKAGHTVFSPEGCFIQPKAKHLSYVNRVTISLYGKKKSISEWAKELGCTVSCLSQRIRKFKKYGIKKVMDLSWTPPRKTNQTTDHLSEDVVKLYTEGKSFAEIRDALGCSTSSIKRLLDKNGVEVRPRFCRSAISVKERIPFVLGELEKGRPLSMLAKELGVCYGTLSYHVRMSKSDK